MKLSVLVCTRNRARSLRATLEWFFAQRFAADYELVIVDNASTDETRQVAERFLENFPDRVRYLFEARPGLSRARNTAIKAARGEIIVFTDDDVLVTTDWLCEIEREFSSDPDLFALGGRVVLARETLQAVAIFTADERREITFPNGGGVAMGANLAFRRELFDRVGLFDVRLGAGTFFAGGEDIEFIYRTLMAGYKFYYAPNVVVAHDHDRTTPQQAQRLIYGYGKAYAAYILKHALRGDRYAMQMVYWLIRALPARWRQQKGDAPNALQLRRAQVRGILVGLVAAPLPMLLQRNEEGSSCAP
jgi:glycosyltransferase involved in cell wall biosynthesis